MIVELEKHMMVTEKLKLKLMVTEGLKLKLKLMVTEGSKLKVTMKMMKKTM